MNPDRPLRDVFDQLSGEASAAQPLDGWPEPLLSEAIVSYADTAPVEVAEHLAPFVTAHTAGAAMPVGQGLQLLASAPTTDQESPVDTDYGAGDRDQPTADAPAPEANEEGEPVSLELDWDVTDLPEPGDLPPALELPADDDVEWGGEVGGGFDEA